MNNILKIFAVLAVFTLLTMPASAYNVKVIGKNSIEFTFHPNEAKDLGRYGSYAAAGVVMDLAKEKGMTVHRSFFDVAFEISTHAFVYVMGERKHSNPVNIGMDEPDRWWFNDGTKKLMDEFKRKPAKLGDFPVRKIPSNLA